MTADLVAFVTARLDEREAAARKAMGDGDGHWQVSAGDGSWGDDMVRTVAVAAGHATGDDMANCGPLQSEHIALNDPAWALGDIAAKRAIVEAHGLENTMSCKTCDPDGDEPYSGRGWYPCYTLRQLAAVYSGHPDYRQEWKP